MGYIYRLISPSGRSYIGQTTRQIEKRLEEHQKPSTCVAIYNAIQHYKWENMKKEWYEVPDEELNFYEEMLISLLGTLAPKGYNLREGGANGKMSEGSKKKNREAQLGKTRTEDTKKLISNATAGEKNGMFKKGHMISGEKNGMFGKIGENNTSSKKVYQYDLKDNFIRSFGSSREATQHLGKKCTSGNIASCARGDPRRPMAYGFKWYYDKL
jgi:group I intron endonuclease